MGYYLRCVGKQLNQKAITSLKAARKYGITHNFVDYPIYVFKGSYNALKTGMSNCVGVITFEKYNAALRGYEIGTFWTNTLKEPRTVHKINADGSIEPVRKWR